MEQLGGLADTFIVYCITAEVRTKRSKGMGLIPVHVKGLTEHVEEIMHREFKDKAK